MSKKRNTRITNKLGFRHNCYVATATYNLKDFCHSGLWTCSHLMTILRSQKNNDFFRFWFYCVALKLHCLFQYGDSADLAAPLPDGRTITDIMHPWIRQSGYPVITLSRQGNTFTVTQKHFVLDPERPLLNSEYKYVKLYSLSLNK